ncbi:MAG: glycoside hydrolase family 15 protein [Planctomycetes bacterium]|nr:glycoside hydrolase family 15 protein [Planctomycetota bacterium]
MAARIEDYALIGDCQTAALVSREGSIDWLCLPRFDSAACFAALLGTPEHGRWLLAPKGEVRECRRRYRDDTLILETDYRTDSGEVTVLDFMPVRSKQLDLIRIVEGRRGQVAMQTEIVIRFDYGSLVPWVRREYSGIVAIAGPDVVHIRSDVPLHGENFRTVADFTVSEGERVSFALTWHPSFEPAPGSIDPGEALDATDNWWRDWSARCTYDDEWREAVLRSLITLKALTYAPSGGLVAAPTTSLPEQIGSVRNWDYRYCWVRDSTFALYALMMNGYREEARAWREWLLRAVAGRASQLNIMYGVTGERRLTELTLDWLPGYENSTPVRIGNAAWQQCQLDIFGEVMDSLHVARSVGLQTSSDGWRVQREMMEELEKRWDQPDEGIWEVRGPRRHFTHSKMMAWVALDRSIRDAEKHGLKCPLDTWRRLRDRIHAEVCEKGFNPKVGAFTQYYGSKDLDASLLMMAQVGFLPPDDPRVRGTVEAIEKHLTHDGFVLRYSTETDVDGLPPGEGVFFMCTFWLADNYALMGRLDDARKLFERLLALRNEVGLLSEEYDPTAKRMLGNFPQAFSHIGLINTARNLVDHQGPAQKRKRGGTD